MHLTLLVPGLVWPREILRDTAFDLPLPALSLLLGRGRHHAGNPLAELSTLPSAALRLLGEGGEPGDGFWLCLDPVHLRVEERAVILDDPARLDLSADEDAALRTSLAPLFGAIVAPRPGRWHLRLPPSDIGTQDLPEAVGHAVDVGLPRGADAKRWRQLLAEAQTLLHDHPVNRAREGAGQPTINSLWPWGPGQLPAATGIRHDEIWSDDTVLHGLGKIAGARTAPLPARFQTAAGSVLARIDSLAAAPPSANVMAWRSALARFDEDWLAPAMAALRRGVLRRLTFVAGDHAVLMLARRDLWRFWRQPLPLSEWQP